MLHENQSLPYSSECNLYLHGSLRNITPWFRGSVLPVRDGWYLAVLDEGNKWKIKRCVLVNFKNGYYNYPIGWPGPNKCVLNMTLNRFGEAVRPVEAGRYFASLTKKVKVIRWCGLLKD